MDYIVEDMMGKIMVFSCIVNLLNILTIVSGILFMHFSAKHRNYKLSTVWYICGVIFSFWTVIVFLIKRKDFPGDKVKVCYQCGAVYPSNFVMCSNCLIDLPEYNSEIKKKEQKLSRIFGFGIIITMVITIVASLAFGFGIAKNIMEYVEYEENYRISVNGVFYDKMGNSYEDENSVILYGEDGKKIYI